MRASSSSQKRGAGAPRKMTGAGTVVSVIVAELAVALGAQVDLEVRSKLLQSRWPS